MPSSPHFIIGGERRCGTTTLYKMMLKHPEINMFPVADMDYFIKNDLFRAREWYLDTDIDQEWYTSHTLKEYLSKFDGLFQGKKIVGQKDADLLFWKPAHARLKDYIPDAKFIFVLRNPIIRANSQYWNEYAKGRETLTFVEAIEAEYDRSQTSDYGRLHLNYKERGRYIDSLENFLQYFPKDQILIVILEKLINNPLEELRRVANFIDVSSEGFLSVLNMHSNHQDVLKIKKQYQGNWIEKLIKLNDRVAEGLIVRISKDRDVKDRYRRYFKSFGKESVRKADYVEPEVLGHLKSYYMESNVKLERFLGREIREWS